MKTLLTLFVFLTSISTASAQFTYKLKIKTTRGLPLTNVVVYAKNTTTGSEMNATTNAQGEVNFDLVEPGNYTFSYKEVKNVATAEVLEGYSGNFSKSVVYDPEGVFAEKPKVDRSTITFSTIKSTARRGQPNVAKVEAHVKQQNGTMVANVNLTYVSIKDRTKYIGRSNNMGIATFYLPNNQHYELDVEGMEAYQQLEVPNYQGMEMMDVVFYEKTILSETQKGDTLVQKNITQTAGTSSHVLFTLTLKDFDGKPLANEPIYMKAMHGPRVFEGITNDQGICKLMLAKGDDYILNVKHESGLIVVEAPSSKGFRTESATRRYRGSALIEKLIAERKAEMERMKAEMERLEKEMAEQARLRKEQEEAQARERSQQLIEQAKHRAIEAKAREAEIQKMMDELKQNVSWEETPVEPLEEPDDYLTKTPDGYDLDFGSAGPASTPTVIDDKMYTQKGIYSSDYFCLDASSGEYVWGVELGESGISPAVYHNGVILINTASCTLYAIDAKTGKLLWSKWLADYVYSTPTADGNDVFVVYSHGDIPVIVSFDLHTGKHNWMEFVDEEAIACPVVYGNEVHLASQNGTYYIFNKSTGRKIQVSTDLVVVSSPTITDKGIYVTITDGENEHLVVLNRKTLKVKKKYPTKMRAQITSGIRDEDETDQMNFNGSHPVVYKNEVVIITDAEHIMAFDCNSEELRWKKPLETNSDQIPIVMNKRVFITSSDGKVMSYDIKTGASKVEKQVSGEIQGQPIARKGFFFIAVGGVVRAIKTASNFEWLQWNKDAGHNTVWE